MASPHENLDERMLHRMLFFTDAVFAIVMTLLVLDLKPPQGVGALDALAAMRSHLVAFAMSFAIIAIFWVAHMNTTRRLMRFDWPVALANLVFLFPVCLIPFVTAWGFNSQGAWAAYCGDMVAISAANVALTLIASRHKGRLEGGLTTRIRLARSSRAAAPGLAFGAGLILLATGQLQLSFLCGALIPLFLWASARIFGPTRLKAEEAAV